MDKYKVKVRNLTEKSKQWILASFSEYNTLKNQKHNI